MALSPRASTQLRASSGLPGRAYFAACTGAPKT